MIWDGEDWISTHKPTLKFALFPKRCSVSGKRIWLDYGRYNKYTKEWYNPTAYTAMLLKR